MVHETLGGTGGEGVRRQAGVKVGGCDSSPRSPSCRGSSRRAVRELPSQPGLVSCSVELAPDASRLELGRQPPVPQPRHFRSQHPSQSVARLGYLCTSAHPCLLFVTGMTYRNETPPNLMKCKCEGQWQGTHFRDSRVGHFGKN